jgi:AcrR family transcriptional regulator
LYPLASFEASVTSKGEFLGIIDPNVAIAQTQRAARSVQKILDAAAKLFGKEGFQGATMMGVARAAGVSKGLLHYHFESKQQLLLAAQRSTFHQLHRRFEERFERGERGLSTALEALDAIWEVIFEMRDWAPFMVESLSLASIDGPDREDLRAFYEESQSLLEAGITHVFADSMDLLMFPPDRFASLVCAAIHGLVVELATAQSEEELHRAEALYRDMRHVFSRTALSGPVPSETPVKECVS